MQAFPLNRGTNASTEKQNFFEWRFTSIEENSNARNIWVFALHHNRFIALRPNRNKNWFFFSANSRQESSIVEKNLNERKYNSAKRNRFYKTP